MSLFGNNNKKDSDGFTLVPETEKKQVEWVSPFTGRVENVEFSAIKEKNDYDETTSYRLSRPLEASNDRWGSIVITKNKDGMVGAVMKNGNEELMITYNKDRNELITTLKNEKEAVEATYYEPDKNKTPTLSSIKSSEEIKSAKGDYKLYSFGTLVAETRYLEENGNITKKDFFYNHESQKLTRSTSVTAPKIAGVPYDKLDFDDKKKVTTDYYEDGKTIASMTKDSIKMDFNREGAITGVRDFSTKNNIYLYQTHPGEIEMDGAEGLSPQEKIKMALEKLAKNKGISPEERGKTGEPDKGIQEHTDHATEFVKNILKMKNQAIRPK